MIPHPVITDLRAMVKALIPRLRDAGQALTLDDEPQVLSGEAFDVLFVRLLSAPAKGRAAGAVKAIREAAFELRIVYEPNGRAEDTSSQALEDAELLLVGISDETSLPPGSPIEHVRFLSAQIERREDVWVLHADLDVLFGEN